MKIITQSDMTVEPVSHACQVDKYVKIKKGEIPHLMNLAVAVLYPSATVAAHFHEDMHEIFFVQSGCVEFCVEGQCMTLEQGSTIVIEPGETHALFNRGSVDARLLYFGLAE